MRAEVVRSGVGFLKALRFFCISYLVEESRSQSLEGKPSSTSTLQAQASYSKSQSSISCLLQWFNRSRS